MNGRCQHNNPEATCCACLTERFRAFEASARKQRADQLAALGAITRFESTTLGLVTIPDRED